ncbi:MAG TPA: amidohydrolase family protein [Candidatus Polarisedimenticolia bacterium]|nr:amidohydrolase family protein [Candidatus Polarisedimenticolia bacterium]
MRRPRFARLALLVAATLPLTAPLRAASTPAVSPRTPAPAVGSPGGSPLPGGSGRRAPVEADVVLLGGPVYTVDAVRTWAEAVAIRGEKIVFVGSAREAAPYIHPKRTRVVDLRGRMVLPAFQDAHIHPILGGVSYAVGCPLYGLATKEEYVRKIGECAKKLAPGEWVRGDGWLLPAFPTGIPDKRLLDAILPDRPAYFESSDGHSAWVNSKALAIAGVDATTPDPAGGRIDREAKTGEPVGGLQDTAMSLVSAKIPPYSHAQRAEGLRYALKMLNRFGITSFQDASVEEDGLRIYRELDDAGQLTARVVAALWWERSQGLEQVPRFVDLRKRYTRGRLRATTVKVMQDGVMEVQTAAVLEPYLGKGPGLGLTMIPPDFLKQVVTALDKEGFQVHFHAIGDAAIRECLDGIETARRANGPRDARHHLSHIELFHPNDVARFRALGAVANFQPLWAYADGYMTDLTLPMLTPARQRWLYPIESLFRSGAVVAFGSDWSVSSANPLEELEVAVTRMGPDGESKTPFIPEERIDLRDALAAFTLNAAYVNFQETTTGSIEVGKLADLIVLDQNLFTIPPEKISEAKVLLTLLGGKPVFGDWSLSTPPAEGSPGG